MSEISKQAQSLSKLLRALGWTIEANRFTVRATEPAFEPVTRVWMVGRSSAINAAEVRAVKPSRIIVEDFATAEQIERLKGLLADNQLPVSVSTYTRFVDELWGAADAQKRAISDSQAGDQDALFGEHLSFSNRHITQDVNFGTDVVADHRALQRGLADPGSWLAILSDAGLGKTEFLRLHEFRSAQLYSSALQSTANVELPPIALRISLRDLRSLSLDYLAHILSQPTQIGGAEVRLPRISSGAALRELMTQGRLILFLDGLDEVAADATTIEAGLKEWSQAVSAGARMVVASRTGHASARGAIVKFFRENDQAAMCPLDKQRAIELLEKRGANQAVALSIYAALSGPAASIPLYLVLANYVGFDKELAPEIRLSKTLVLQTLIEHFCQREVSRLGVDSETQMEILDQIAEWMSVDASASREELLETLGCDSDDARARIILNPHALLVHNGRGGVSFKFPEFEALFMARTLAGLWKNGGFNSVQSVLRSKRLDELVIEYLARFIHPSTISGAWIESEVDSGRGLILRRNLLAIALAKVNDGAPGNPAKARAESLATVVGNRSLINVSFAGLRFERFDFSGWEFKNIKGDDGVLAYCENLNQASYDDSVGSLLLEECSFDSDSEQEVDYERAIAALVQVIKPLRRKTGGALVGMMSVDEARNPLAWNKLQKAGMASRTGKARSAKWELTSQGTRLLTSFNNAHLQGGQVLGGLIENDVEIRDLLMRFA